VIVTTSWDDGHRLDLRVAELLRDYQVPGTFYVSPRDSEFKPDDLLMRCDILDLSAGFEIGAHTLTHPRLTKVSAAAARDEIAGSKSYIEDITGRPVNSFCYPYGMFDAMHVQMVRQAGFSYARTVQRFSRDTGDDPLRAPTTVHAYSHRVDIPQAVALGKRNPLSAWSMYAHWDQMAERVFDEVLAKGGVFHLWGHSWEVDKNNDWYALRRVLDYISQRPEVTYLANSGLREADAGSA
jgi:peptidoglycan/xylan/chitin deacetylase (PgdA/CDA1 family)